MSPSQPDEARVAVVTGAARGIGAATVRELVRNGYAVAALDCVEGAEIVGIDYPLASRSDLAELAASAPDLILPIACDVRDATQVLQAVERTVEQFDRIDAVVAGAGVVAGGHPQWETPTDELQALLAVNVLGVWNTAAATIPHLLAGPAPAEARFVAIASTAGEHGLFHLTGYCASKHAVIGIVRGLAADLVGTGVTACAIAPGSTDTAILQTTANLYGTTTQDLADHQAVRRLLRPEEIAATVALCCSPAGAVFNGSVVNADGGFGL